MEPSLKGERGDHASSSGANYVGDGEERGLNNIYCEIGREVDKLSCKKRKNPVRRRRGTDRTEPLQRACDAEEAATSCPGCGEGTSTDQVARGGPSSHGSRAFTKPGRPLPKVWQFQYSRLRSSIPCVIRRWPACCMRGTLVRHSTKLPAR
jgi:hypothetical protein